MDFGARFAHDPSDTDETRLQKVAILLVAGCCSIAGLVWSAMYVATIGWGFTASLPVVFTIVVGSALGLSHVTRNHRIAVWAQIVCIVGITAGIQWSMGGLWDSGFVLAWSLCAPMAALFFLSTRAAAAWFAIYMTAFVVTLAFDDVFAANRYDVSEGLQMIFFGMNIAVSSFVVFLFTGYSVTRARAERQRAEALLLNILPREIAPRLKADANATIADQVDSASVLFADMVGSTPLFADMSAAQAVDWLNEIFSTFDRLVDKYGAEKIRTIGDNYMVAVGVPTERHDHAEVLTRLAIEMRDAVEHLAPRNGKKMVFRFGIHSGPLIAGVIGETKFQYDLWGDTVNVASRMESHGEIGRVHVSAATYELLDASGFACERRGVVAVKGRGEMETWFINGRVDDAAE